MASELRVSRAKVLFPAAGYASALNPLPKHVVSVESQSQIRHGVAGHVAALCTFVGTANAARIGRRKHRGGCLHRSARRGRWSPKQYGKDKIWKEVADKRWKQFQAEEAQQYWQLEPGKDPAYVDNSQVGVEEEDGGWFEEGQPNHVLPLLILDAKAIPGVGELQIVRINESDNGPGAVAAINFASAKKGLIWCAPEVEDAVSIPRGGIGAAITSLARISESEVCVGLRGITCVRLLVRHPPRKLAQGLVLARVEEVHDWCPQELAVPLQDIQADLQSLEELFSACGELQTKTDLRAAGNFASPSLEERAQEVLEALEELPLSAALDDGSRPAAEDEAELRRISATVHAISAAFSGSMRIGLLCDPHPILTRMQQVRELLEKVRKVLCARLAFKSAFEEGEGGGQGA
mmetsp:Transcript_30011/g.54687  ORF Transcript_30011/g.54687 Transcript_30011/m.54687 type:complete len:407 (-) Transcript_30011:213-1433(-)